MSEAARHLNRALVSLGSNIQPAENLRAAVRALERFGKILKVSQVWESAPVGDVDQPNYFNAAVLIETPLSADRFKAEVLAAIERQLQRVRDPANVNAPRTIDLDLSFFNEDVRQIEHRPVPDPDVLRRAFVAIPLAEVAPDYRHPETGQTLADIAVTFDPQDWSMRLRPEMKLTPQKATGGLQSPGHVAE